jgi:hypothetical protein
VTKGGSVQRLIGWLIGWGSNNWLTVTVICSFMSGVISEINEHFLLAEVMITIAVSTASYLLFRLTRAWLERIWNSAVGKIGLGFFSLLVITGARTLADVQITYTTGASASLFPRAQDLLTLFFSFSLWFL